MSETIELVVDANHAGDRLDRTLTALVPDSSRTTIQRHIEAGAVLVDGEVPARGAKTKVEAGQTIAYTPPPPEPAAAAGAHAAALAHAQVSLAV